MPKVQAGSGSRIGAASVAAAACRTSLAEINVVPLVDVMLVLLIIFMVTAPMIQRGVDVNLPVARRAGADRGRAGVRHGSGDISRRPHRCTSARSRFASRSSRSASDRKWSRLTDKQVYLRGDGDVLYQDLMDVFDRLKGAGVERVGLVAKVPGER